MNNKMSNIIIHIDTREDDLLKLITARGTLSNVVSTNLEVGDILIANKETEQPFLVLERKTLSDLASSNRDGRYREQRARLLSLKGQGVSIGYIIEAQSSWSNDLSRMWPGKVGESTLLSIILRLQLRYGIPVITSSSTENTVTIISHIVKMITDDPDVFVSGLATDGVVAAAAYTEALSAQKSANRNLKRVGSGMLCAIPGVGAKMSETILDACGGTIESLMNKKEDEIAELKVGKRCVGKILAATIWSALHTK